MVMKSILVAGSGNVTGMNVIKALVGNKDINVYGCDYEAVNPSNQWCISFEVPRCAESGYTKAISDIVEENRITHIIATNDHDVRALTMLNELRVSFPIFNGYSKNILRCLDKRETIKMFLNAGVQTPVEVLSKKDYPYVLRKEAMGNNAKYVHIVKNDEDLAKIPDEHFINGIMTRYVQGVEYTVDILCDNNSNVLSAIPRKRIKVVGGMVHHAQIIEESRLIDLCVKVAKSVRLVGMNCIQCMVNGEDYYFIEINPRPGSGIDLSIRSGVNMPLLWVRESMGEEYNISDPKWGLQMKRYYEGYFF